MQTKLRTHWLQIWRSPPWNYSKIIRKFETIRDFYCRLWRTWSRGRFWRRSRKWWCCRQGWGELCWYLKNIQENLDILKNWKGWGEITDEENQSWFVYINLILQKWLLSEPILQGSTQLKLSAYRKVFSWAKNTQIFLSNKYCTDKMITVRSAPEGGYGAPAPVTRTEEEYGAPGSWVETSSFSLIQPAR